MQTLRDLAKAKVERQKQERDEERRVEAENNRAARIDEANLFARQLLGEQAAAVLVWESQWGSVAEADLGDGFSLEYESYPKGFIDSPSGFLKLVWRCGSCRHRREETVQSLEHLGRLFDELAANSGGGDA
jgi:hypothetical protein